MEGKYIYGIIKSSNGFPLGITGVGSEGPAYTLSSRGLGCVLSDYSGPEMSSLSKEKVLQCLLAHQRVVEQVMREHTVLPMKFGTLLATSDEVYDLLSQSYGKFTETLAWIQDKVEVEVAATWDTEKVLQEIGNEEDILRAKEALAGRPGATLEERIRLGRIVKASLDRRRNKHRERMIDLLRPVAVEVQPNALFSDQMVMNVAFLVERGQQEEFDSRVRQLNDLFHDQIDFRILGPLPPYSFATVVVARLNPEQIEEARKLLGLGQVSEPAVRKAYRHRAAETHPDHNPGMAKTNLVPLRRAADLLIASCRGGAGFSIQIRRPGEEGLWAAQNSED